MQKPLTGNGDATRHGIYHFHIDFEPSETSGGQPMALGASVFGLHFWDSIDHFVFGDFFVF